MAKPPRNRNAAVLGKFCQYLMTSHTGIATSLFVLVLLLALTSAAQYDVIVGYNSNGWEIMHFIPQNLTVQQGDSIRFTVHGDGHTVTFNRTIVTSFADLTSLQWNVGYTPVRATEPISSPDLLYSSGNMIEGNSWTATFSTVGTFHFNCMYHPYMEGWITVVPGPAPSSVSEVALNVQQTLNAYLQQIPAYESSQNVRATTAPYTTLPSGARNYVIKVGAGSSLTDPLKLSFNSFIPANLTINANDAITFQRLDSWNPHTVNFNNSNIFNYDDVVLPNGQLGSNPNYVFPMGNATHAVSGFVTSGLMFASEATLGVSLVLPAYTMQFNITFTKTGTFKYICHVHDFMGMNGFITVQSGSATSSAASGVLVVNSSALLLLFASISLLFLY